MKSLITTILACITVISAQAQGYRIVNNEVNPDSEISFVGETAKLSSESNKALVNIQKYLENKPYITLLRVEGHAEGYGNSCQSLSESQAIAVCTWLVNHGVDCKRLIAVGFGDTKPISYEGQGAHLRNSRIVFVNAALRGHAIGGMPADGGGKVAGDACAE